MADGQVKGTGRGTGSPFPADLALEHAPPNDDDVIIRVDIVGWELIWSCLLM